MWEHVRGWIQTASIASLCGVLALCALRITRAVTGNVKELTVTEGSLNRALATVNRPCAPGPCGTLAEINKSAIKLQDVTVTLQRQVAQSSKLVNATTADLDRTTDGLNAEIASLNKLTDAATTDAQAALPVMRTAQTAIQGFQPLLRHADATVGHVDDLVLNPDLKDTIENVDGMTANLNASTGDFQKRFHSILFPPPCKTFGCRFARYAWPALKDGAALGSDLYWTGQILGRAVPVKIQH